MIFFASTAKNIEPLLLEELKALGASSAKATHLGVVFQGGLDLAYRVCLWSRLTHHLFLELKTFQARNQENLYGAIRSVNWATHFDASQTFRIDVTGHHPTLVHPHFIAQVAKDAIVDQFRQNTGQRPTIQAEQPDLVFHLHVREEAFTLSLDLSGDSLHKRGIRTSTGEAPLKETLAAALLIRAGWPQRMKEKRTLLLDPCCGAGTILLEGAMMAYDIAPGLLRSYFGFLGWQKHDPALWARCQEEAKARREAGRKARLPILGFDIHPPTLLQAEKNFAALKLSHIVHLECRDAADFTHPLLQDHQGLLLTNPPYGKRLMTGQTDAITGLYARLGVSLKHHLENWKAAIFTSDPAPVKALRMRPQKQYAFLNGSLPCTLICFEVLPEHYWVN